MRHFLANPDDVRDGRVTITGPDAAHIIRVLRLGRGGEIVVSAGEAGRFRCEISDTGGGRVTAKIVERIEEPINPIPEITLAQGIPKARKMDDIVRMACELGAAEIVPVITKRCVVKLDGDSAERKTERWREIAHAAAKQSIAASPTRISAPVLLSALGKKSDTELCVVLWEEASASLKSVLTANPSPSSIRILIGPEGGLDAEEVELLANRGFVAVSFGHKILRTETAGAAAISAIIYHYTD